jgi:predicted enzyme related to lactoylglutathione lyase
MHRITHFEIPSDNPEKAMQFYGSIFGWKFQQFDDNPYWLADTGPADKPGINGAIMQKRDPRQPMTNAISVDDIDSVIAAIQSNSGVIVVPKTPIPGVGWMAYFTDPDKNIVGVWQDDVNAK